MKSHLLKITPLGGIGQIGSNMTLIQGENDTILIDAGILFPYEEFFDIDYLIPNISNIPAPQYLVITHAHEDHIGAVIHVVSQFPEIKVFASPFAAALIRKKLEFNGQSFPIKEYRINDQLIFNDFKIDPIHVNHSIPESQGLLLRDNQDKFGLFFISDFKIDHHNIYEPPFDFDKLSKLSKNLVKRVLMADSTNLTSSTLRTPSEMEIIPVMDELFATATGRIFITCFSSNIHRLKTFINLAIKHQRKVVAHGRSMNSYLNTANEQGMIENFDSAIKSAESLSPNQENIVVLLSGCQGDFKGTFRRYCMGEDSVFKPRKEDLVLMSSKSIPGNEKKIGMLLNKLSEVGARIVTSQEKLLHVSGHAGKNDLIELYEKYKPTDIVPIHGETLFIRDHIELIKEHFPSAKAHYILNFDSLLVSHDLQLSSEEGEKLDPLIIHGKQLVLEKEKISERRKLANNGSVFISLKLSKNKMAVDSSSFTMQGLPAMVSANGEKFNRFLENYLVQTDFKNPEKAAEDLRIAIRRYFDHILGYKPQTFVHIL